MSAESIILPITASSLPITPSFSLQGLRALVSGGSRGLGLAAAAALAQAGARVSLLALAKPELEQTAQLFAESGFTVATHALDLRETKKVKELILAEQPFDILVNNAGTNHPQHFFDVDAATYERIVNLNLRATFFLSQAVARRISATGKQGSIINVSSIMGRVAGEQRTVYCASKHGVEGLTKAMALELAPHGIRVNSIAPTFILTEMTRPYLTAELRATIIARTPLGRVGELEDIMGAIVFLASAASSLLTGTSIAIDGGWTAV